MNSLPFISHHLFVAAIGNEGRGHENPVRPERQFTAPSGQGGVMALEALGMINARKPMSESAAGASRASNSQALT